MVLGEITGKISKSSVETINITKQIQQYLPGAKPILVKGFSSSNTDYTIAKRPVAAGWGKDDFKTYNPPTEEEINVHNHAKGWIGAAIDENYCVVDIDTLKNEQKQEILSGPVIGKMLLNLLKSEGFNFHAIQTPNGMQFIFKLPKDSGLKNHVKEVSPLGLVPDYRTFGGMIVFPTLGTEGRFILHTSEGELDEVPYFLKPLYKHSFNKDGDPNFPLFPFSKGGRNNELNKFLFLLRTNASEKLTANMIQEVGYLVNKYFTVPPLEKKELDATISSVLSARVDITRQTYELIVDEQNGLEQFIIPKPFIIKNGMIYRERHKKVEGIQVDVLYPVCRHIPIITQSFTNAEKSQLYYEIQWTDHGRKYRETVSAGTLAIKKDLLKLADKSLGVTDLNAKDLIEFFDRFITCNDIPGGALVERLGHVKGGFIHPLLSDSVKILPPDIGDKQIVEAFNLQGTADEWVSEVFEKVKDHPKAVLILLGSFTSVILNDLKLSPFIIDLSGPTSFGKTTVLKVGASVWGSGHLVGEWNITKVAAERKAAFLNSFPIILDDTMKADGNQLKSFVYNFSGGRSKGRGSIEGTQTEFTWNNLMLSTGETSLTEYTQQAAGAAARVLPIVGLPFEGVDHNFFNELYEAMEIYHGAIGLEFLKKWQDKKEVLLPLYKDFNIQFQKKSNGNEVLGRIARHYAALIFTAHLLNDFFQMDINLNELTNLFDEIARENKAIDKPMQLLEAILSDLDADRSTIYRDYAPPREKIKALYRDGTLILLPAYLNEFLKTEQKAIRSEWLRREISLIGSIRNGKRVDSKQYKKCGDNFLGVAISPEIIKELGFDFSTEK